MKEDARTRTPIEQVLREDPEAAREFLDTAYAVDIATFLEELPPQTAEAQLLSLPLARQTAVFRYLKPGGQVKLAQRLERGQLAQIVSAMNADDRTDLFNRLSPEQQEALLPGLAQAAREDIRRLAGHAEGTAGALMTSDYVALRSDITVREALDVLRREAPDKETIYRTYVIDDDRRLVSSVRLRDLILAQPETRVSEVMISETLAVGVEDSQEDVARKIARYDVIAVPVVDSDGRLVGIVTHDDALDALQEEATEDFHRIGTVGKLSESVRNASMRTLYRKRIFWLALLIVGNLFSGAGIAYFEETISSHVGLLFFLPLLIGSSGNAGSQSATLMVRAIATGDVVMRDWGRLLGRELLVALALGLTLALAVSAIGLLRGGVDIALVVSLTMVLVVLVGSLIGLSLPFLLDRMKLDPATASAPLVTTIADAVGVIIFFTIATVVLFQPAI
ncbi:magnesium transporter [Fodinicurvata fenggangensis]|uniref:magnesium transporter n=1 Tax=Fodinicurvata fenggangensis TaxID=1121830 RepID=UPI00054EB011|nr:magnesium transporter [Fodinicurvata fenggangensis]